MLVKTGCPYHKFNEKIKSDELCVGLETYFYLYQLLFVAKGSSDRAICIWTLGMIPNFFKIQQTLAGTQWDLGPFYVVFISGKFYQKLVMRPNFSNYYWKLVTGPISIVNFNCHHDQILVIITKNWSHNQFQLSSRPNISNFFFKNWSYNQFQLSSQPDLVIFTENWSPDQFQLSSRPNFGNFYQKLVTQLISIATK